MTFSNLPINKEIDRFRFHLEELDNNRIIFSGIFGIGKTYFIEKFFEKETKYIPIKLNPVNYSVSQSQDIFELIKYDIAFQLLTKNPDFDKTNFSKFFTGQFYIVENYKSMISNLIENLSKIDHQINSIVAPAIKLGKQIAEHHEKVNIDDRKELIEFLTFFKGQKGTIREENNISELLLALISTLKKDDKKVVLVIDDLDRIDPEHIFRLLNIFSAHFDFQETEGENKFGFDKIILICDIENIRGIFHNKYGAEIDFSGYIDKFYSSEVFYYKLEDVIKENLDSFLKSIKSGNTFFSQHLNASNSYFQNHLQFLLSYFIESNALSLRRLLSFLNQDVTIKTYQLKFSNSARNPIHSDSTPITIVLDILEKLFGSKHNFLTAIDKVIDKHRLVYLDRYGNYTDVAIGSMAMLAGYLDSNLVPTTDTYTHKYNIHDYIVEYTINVFNHSYGVTGHVKKILSPKLNEADSSSQNVYILPYFQLLRDAYLAKKAIVKRYE